MRLVKAGKVVEDQFVRIADDAALPDHGAVIVTAARFLAEAAELTSRPTAVGVIWPNNKPVSELAPHLDKIALIVLAFPGFRDGRAYSQARILRERYGFRGELRASGQVLRDQFLLMLRAGFDAFEVAKDGDAGAFADSIRKFDVFYQPTGDGRATAFRRRMAEAIRSGKSHATSA